MRVIFLKSFDESERVGGVVGGLDSEIDLEKLSTFGDDPGASSGEIESSGDVSNFAAGVEGVRRARRSNEGVWRLT